MDKQEIRRSMRRLNLALDTSDRAAASAKIIAHIELMEPFAEAQTVALFTSLPDELDTTEALKRWSHTKRLVVPRVEGDIMHFYDYVPGELSCGAFGIAEPKAEKICDPSQIDFMVVPGTAFTAEGIRMGRGRGYYDKYLSLPGFRAYKVGVCYEHQITSSLQAEPHDVMMDCVVCK